MKNTIKNKIKKDDYFNKKQTNISIKIIDMFNEQNTLQISQRKLSKTLKVSRETVRRLILKLIKHNYLKILMQGRQGSGTKYELSCLDNEKTDDVFDDDFSFEDEISESSYVLDKRKDISKTANKSLMQRMEETENKKQQREELSKSELEAFTQSMLEPSNLKCNGPYICSDISFPKADDLIPYTKPISKLNHKPIITPERKIELLEELVDIQEKQIKMLEDELKVKQTFIDECIVILKNQKDFLEKLF